MLLHLLKGAVTLLQHFWLKDEGKTKWRNYQQGAVKMSLFPGIATGFLFRNGTWNIYRAKTIGVYEKAEFQHNEAVLDRK